MDDADAIVENFRPGRLKTWGFDYATMRHINPGLVMLHISGWGQKGPYSQRPGLGTLAEAFSGFVHVTGEADGPKTLPAYPVADTMAALTCAYSLMAALFNRERNGGVGDHLLESMIHSEGFAGRPLLPSAPLDQRAVRVLPARHRAEPRVIELENRLGERAG